MKCQICNNNEANIVFTQIINTEKIVLKICSECAKKKGISVEIDKPTQPKVNSFIGSITGDFVYKEDKDIPDLTCTVCGLTFAEFKKEGLFGCDQCHIFFGNHISNLLKQIHGTDIHEGKLPNALSKEGEEILNLRKLREELKKSIDLEDYEKAAVLRDKIAILQEKKVKK
ncbi:UvrB/UvrC motif-containing protein [Candidatus Latescibacterota bacterium]